MLTKYDRYHKGLLNLASLVVNYSICNCGVSYGEIVTRFMCGCKRYHGFLIIVNRWFYPLYTHYFITVIDMYFDVIRNVNKLWCALVCIKI